MHSAQLLSLLALAGSALAAPAPYGGRRPNRHVVWETVVHTAYVTVPFGGQHPTATPSVPKPTTSKVPVYVAPTHTPEPVEAAPSKPAYSAAPAPAPSAKPSAAPAPPSGSTGYMAIVDEYRSLMGMSALKVDSTLEANARKTAADGNGQMVHQLNPGSFAQVLAPGDEGDFEHVFLGGWLCERPSLPGLEGKCESASQGWIHDSTGHADIITSKSYSKIGCDCVTGIWACDFA